MNHLIIGYGEIGQAISSLLNGNIEYIDFDKSNVNSKEFDVIHICYGFSNNFVDSVKKYVSKYKYKYIMIHSTIEVGTTDKLKEYNVIYSPVRGRHTGQGFVEDIKKYTKYYSGDIDKNDIESYFKSVQFEMVKDHKSLEFAKPLSTTYTLLNVLFEKWIYSKCMELGLDYEFVYREWNKTYNDNVNPEWKRPVYNRMAGNVGGHCLIPNLDLINDDFIDMMKILNRRYGSI